MFLKQATRFEMVYAVFFKLKKDSQVKGVLGLLQPEVDINALPASCQFRRLLMIFANSLDLDQDQQNLDPNSLTLW